MLHFTEEEIDEQLSNSSKTTEKQKKEADSKAPKLMSRAKLLGGGMQLPQIVLERSPFVYSAAIS